MVQIVRSSTDEDLITARGPTQRLVPINPSVDAIPGVVPRTSLSIAAARHPLHLILPSQPAPRLTIYAPIALHARHLTEARDAVQVLVNDAEISTISNKKKPCAEEPAITADDSTNAGKTFAITNVGNSAEENRHLGEQNNGKLISLCEDATIPKLENWKREHTACPELFSILGKSSTAGKSPVEKAQRVPQASPSIARRAVADDLVTCSEKPAALVPEGIATSANLSTSKAISLVPPPSKFAHNVKVDEVMPDVPPATPAHAPSRSNIGWIPPPGPMTIRTYGFVPRDVTRSGAVPRVRQSTSTMSEDTTRTFPTMRFSTDRLDFEDETSTRGFFGFLAGRFSSGTRARGHDVDTDAAPTLLQRVFGSRISSSFGSLFTRRNLSRTSDSTREPAKFIHRGPLSEVIADAARDLISDHKQRPARTANRVPGTMSSRGSHTWEENDRRAIRETAPPPRAFGSARAPVYIATSAAAMHRALEKEWMDADVITRSIAVRALDVNEDDAKAADAFFAVTDAFIRAYFSGSDFVLGGTGIEERAAARESAIEALDNFATAREVFLERQDLETTHRFLGHAEVAKLCTLAATRTEARGVGELVHARLSDVAAELSRAKGGPFLVLMLASGAAGSKRGEAAWAKRVLFPRRLRAPRPLCMHRLNKKFEAIHRSYVQTFSDAEAEYRELFRER